ncbi:MAG: thiamine ABC transporter substrate binding subunit [Actinomycetales bacterium]
MHRRSSRVWTPLRLVCLLAMGGGLLVACTSPGPATSTEQDWAPGTPVTVRMLTHDSFAVSQSLLDDLRTQTGIDLQVITSGDAGAMVSGAILTAGAPSADVLFGVDNTLLARALEAEVFQPYEITDPQVILPALTQGTGGVVTPVDYGDVCINIDTKWYADAQLAPPTSLADLIDPRYRGQLVVTDPATSSPGLAFLLSTIASYEQDWPTYWESLRANDVAVVGSWSDAYYGSFSLSGGDRPLVVSYATSPPAEIVYAEGTPPAQPQSAVLTDGCYRQIEYAGVLRGTQHPTAAGAVIDWLLSPQVQADIPLSMFVFPAREGTPLPEVFTRFAAQVPEPAQLPATEVADNLKTWLTEWDTVMQR